MLGQQPLSDGHGSECMGGPRWAWKQVHGRATIGVKACVCEGSDGQKRFCEGTGGVCGHARLRGMEASPSAPACPAGLTAAAAAAAGKSFSPPLSMKLLCTHTPLHTRTRAREKAIMPGLTSLHSFINIYLDQIVTVNRHATRVHLPRRDGV